MYSYYGHCSYDNCLLEEDLLDNHLYCKYHGCIYHPQTGHIQEGPSMYSLQPLQLDRLQHTDNNHLYMLHLPDQLEGFTLDTLVPYAPPDFTQQLIYGGQFGFVEYIRLLRKHFYTGKVYLVDPQDQYQWLDYYTQCQQMLGLGRTGIHLDHQALATKLNIHILPNSSLDVINPEKCNFQLQNREKAINCKAILVNYMREFLNEEGIEESSEVIVGRNIEEYKKVKEWLDKGGNHLHIIGINNKSVELANLFVEYKQGLQIDMYTPDTRHQTQLLHLDTIQPLLATRGTTLHFGSHIQQVLYNLISSSNHLLLVMNTQGINKDNTKLREEAVLKLHNNYNNTNNTYINSDNNNNIDNNDNEMNAYDSRHKLESDNFLKCKNYKHIYCLGGGCCTAYWNYPISISNDSPDQLLQQNRLVLHNQYALPQVYIPHFYQWLRVGHQVVNSIGITHLHNTITNINFTDNNEQKLIKLYFQDNYFVGASTVNAQKQLLLLRQYFKKGKVLNQKDIQHMKNNQFHLLT